MRRLEREKILLNYTTRVEVCKLADIVVVLVQISLAKQGLDVRSSFAAPFG